MAFVLPLAGSSQSAARGKAGMRGELRDDSYSVYPNPSPGKFTISVKDIDQPFDVNVYNLIGELVFHRSSETRGPQNVEVNLSKQPAGVYFVEIDTDRVNLLKKVIIDHNKND